MPDFEEYLRSLYPAELSRIEEAECYSLLAGGKRIRPSLLFAVLKGCGRDPSAGYPAAAALEMIHTYSLIHDDLPAMDDDDLRRGKPSSHVVYGEAMAILAGDALLTRAFEVLSRQECENLSELVREYARAAGDRGMILGQVLDLEAESQSGLGVEDLQKIDLNKTGRLLALPLTAGGLIGGYRNDLPVLREIGHSIGLAFQIQDDIFDLTKSAAEMGKNPSDRRNEKATYASLLGVEKARSLAEECFQRAYAYTDSLSLNGSYLKEMIEAVQNRRN